MTFHSENPMYITALALWAAFLIAALFYTPRARNSRTRPLAAYLIFSAVFTMTSFVVFAVIIAVLGRGWAVARVSRPNRRGNISLRGIRSGLAGRPVAAAQTASSAGAALTDDPSSPLRRVAP